MMYWIVDWSVRFRRIVVVLAAGLLVLGFLQLDDAKQDILPEFSPVTVEVQTEALGLSAAEVEQLITVPLEQDLLNGVAFLEEIESASLPGLSSVVMTFESGTDLLDARQVVTERLTQAAGLPQVADPPQMLQPLSSTSRVAMVSLRSSELTPIEISVLARWVMLPRLLGVDGVANVAIWGFRDQQLQVLVDPAELATSNVTLSQVISTAGNALEVSPLSFLEASLPGTGGFIDTVNQRLHVFHEQAISSHEELARVTVEGIEGGAVFVGGEPVVLSDVADIVTDHQPLIGDARCAAGPCILLVIEKFPDANTPAVARDVDEALAALSLGLPGMEIDSSIYQPATFIEESTSNLRSALIIGSVLLLLALAAFLFSWRIVLIAAASIALSVVTAGVVFVLLDVTVNLMVLAGIVMALAMIINDSIAAALGARDAVPIAEDGPVGSPQLAASVMDVTLRLRSVAMYAAIIVAAALFPVIAMEGAAGAFLEPIAIAYLVAVASALLVGLVVTPALSMLLLTGGRSALPESPVAIRVRDWYRGRARRHLRRTGGAVATWVVVVVVGLVAAALATPSLRPEVKERDVLIQLEAAPGTSLTRMDLITSQLVEDLGRQPGVVNVGAHIGRAVMSDRVVNVNSGEIWLNIALSADYEATLEQIESLVAGATDVASRVTTYSQLRIAEIIDRVDDRLVVRVYGENAQIRQEMAEEVLTAVATVDGVEDPRIETVIEEPALEIEVDLDAAQAFGVKPGDVRRQAATLVSGLVVGNLFDDQKVFDVVVWGHPEIRDTVEDIRRLPIATPSGDQVPLGDLAAVRIESNPAVIHHESTATYTDVTARVSDRTVSSTAADVDAAIAEIPFPLEHHAEVLGNFEDVLAARSRVLAAGVAAVVVIYLLLQAAFASWRLATLAFLALPMGVAGSLAAVAVTGGGVSLGSVAGTMAVFGLGVHGVLLLFKRYQRRERLGEPFGEDLIVDGAAHTVVTFSGSTVAVALVFLPLAVFGSQAGLELAGPMAVAVLGGVITTLAMTVFVAPALYLRWGFVAEPDTSADDLYDARVPAAAGRGG